MSCIIMSVYCCRLLYGSFQEEYQSFLKTFVSEKKLPLNFHCCYSSLSVIILPTADAAVREVKEETGVDSGEILFFIQSL